MLAATDPSSSVATVVAGFWFFFFHCKMMRWLMMQYEVTQMSNVEENLTDEESGDSED